MKNKSAVLFVLGMLSCMGVVVHAAAGVRGSKGTSSIPQTTNSVSLSTGPAVLYSVVLGTGAVTDFVTLFDSNSVSGLLSGTQTVGSGYLMRLYPSSATQNTNIVFDPPLQLNKGLVLIPATSLGSILVTYERGRVTNGY